MQLSVFLARRSGVFRRRNSAESHVRACRYVSSTVPTSGAVKAAGAAADWLILIGAGQLTSRRRAELLARAPAQSPGKQSVMGDKSEVEECYLL